jgi:hypothetical protein
LIMRFIFSVENREDYDRYQTITEVILRETNSL